MAFMWVVQLVMTKLGKTHDSLTVHMSWVVTTILREMLRYYRKFKILLHGLSYIVEASIFMKKQLERKRTVFHGCWRHSSK